MNRLRVSGPPVALARWVRGQVSASDGLALLRATNDVDDRHIPQGPRFLRVFDRGPGAIEYRFETAWDPPVHWLRAAATANTTLVFELLYAEPLMELYGRLVYKFGVPVVDTSFVSEDEAMPVFDACGWDVAGDEQYGNEALIGRGVAPVSVVEARIRRHYEIWGPESATEVQQALWPAWSPASEGRA